jgi:hypothetical protein
MYGFPTPIIPFSRLADHYPLNPIVYILPQNPIVYVHPQNPIVYIHPQNPIVYVPVAFFKRPDKVLSRALKPHSYVRLNRWRILLSISLPLGYISSEAWATTLTSLKLHPWTSNTAPLGMACFVPLAIKNTSLVLLPLIREFSIRTGIGGGS